MIEATSKPQRTREERLKLLILAEELLTTSINKRRHNWFAFTTRMSVRKEIAKINYRSNNRTITKRLFEQAKEDGHECFVTRGGSKSLCILSEICQQLATFPHMNKHGFRFVEEQHFLLDALHYLHFALHQSGPTHYKVCFQLASVLYDLHDLKLAIEWMKRAMSVSNDQSNFACQLVCEYLVEKYREDTREKLNTVYLIKDLLFMLFQGMCKFENIDNIFISLYQNWSESLFLMLENIFKVHNLIDLTRMNVLSNLLDVLSRGQSLRIERESLKRLHDYKQRLRNLQITDDRDPDFEEEFTSGSSIPRRLKTSPSLNGLEFDFFICNSSKDSDWVTSKLLPDLESDLTDGDVPLKGCIADRDFIPGKSIFKNIEHSIRNSFKIILVLSKNFTESYWCQFEKEEALISSFDSKIDCVIPLLLDDCEIPLELRNCTYANFRNEREYMNEIIKLKRVLLIPQ